MEWILSIGLINTLNVQIMPFVMLNQILYEISFKTKTETKKPSDHIERKCWRHKENSFPSVNIVQNGNKYNKIP